ncbi:MAG: hypothetical protein LBS00_02715, partial [Synergistaceae bacterium]|nr:hypothetical protein [Synergistaceae bacterium]
MAQTEAEQVSARTHGNDENKDLQSPGNFDYDNLWKTVLERYFWDALKIFLPSLYEAADRSRKPKFLSQELNKVTFDLKGGANRADLLVEIKLKNSRKNKLILCHLESQGKGGGNLPVRMYRYKEAIHLLRGKEPIGIVLITAPRPKKEKDHYSVEQFGVAVFYKYVNVIVMDLDDEVLLEEGNQIGLVLYALKCAIKSGNDEGLKFRHMREISNLWARRGWDAEDKRIILQAVEYLMRIENQDYAKQIVAHIASLVESLKEEEKNMYTSVFERVYKEEGRMEGFNEGRNEGFNEGRTEGFNEGRNEGQVLVARNMLNDGFPVGKVVQYTTLSREEVEKL